IDQIYGNPGFGGSMYTAGSNAVTSYYRPLRMLGAQVRRVLLDNAARKWGVPVEELTTEPSVVVHAKSGRRLGYSEIAVIAEMPWAAFDARRAVADSVSWSKGGKAWGFDSDKGLDTFLASARDSTVNGSDWFKTGDARAELPKSATAMEAEYLCDYAYHAQMEPLNAVASVSAAGDSAEIWVGTQSQSNAQEATAKALGIARDKVKVHDLLLGGGFGRRGPRDMDFLIDAVLLAK